VNLGVSAFSRQPDLAFAAAECLRGPTNQRLAAIRGGLPPTVAAVYDDPAVRAQYPFGALLRDAIAAAAPRPATPAYHDVSLAVRRTLHPPSTVDPDRSGAALRELVARALRSQALL
jgi:multiple sugar transport system substrate-binding protein